MSLPTILIDGLLCHCFF